MTKAVQDTTLSPSRAFPPNKLVLSQSNVRHIKVGVSVAQLAESIARRCFCRAAATEAGRSDLTPEAAFTALLDGKVIVGLTETLRLRRVRGIGADRIARDRLRACGLFGRIISWKLRFCVPVDATGSAVLASYLVARVADRAGA
jgi:hypothetical protein